MSKMVNVIRKWIKENVEQLSAFGNQITLDNFEEYVVGQKSLQTTLTGAGKEKVEGRESTEKFHILIPRVGWADCYGYNPQADMEAALKKEQEEEDHSHFYEY